MYHRIAMLPAGNPSLIPQRHARSLLISRLRKFTNSQLFHQTNVLISSRQTRQTHGPATASIRSDRRKAGSPHSIAADNLFCSIVVKFSRHSNYSISIFAQFSSLPRSYLSGIIFRSQTCRQNISFASDPTRQFRPCSITQKRLTFDVTCLSRPGAWFVHQNVTN